MLKKIKNRKVWIVFLGWVPGAILALLGFRVTGVLVAYLMGLYGVKALIKD